jgi:hypothetical protein
MAALTRIADRTDDESLPAATADRARRQGDAPGPGALADIVDQVSRKYGVFFLAGHILLAGKMSGAIKEDPHHVRD